MDELQKSRDDMSLADKLIRAAQSMSNYGATAPQILEAYHGLSSDGERAAFVAVLAARLDIILLRQC